MAISLTKRQRQAMTPFVEKASAAYFGLAIENQDNNWIPHKVYRSCLEGLHLQVTYHTKGCYFCPADVKG